MRPLYVFLFPMLAPSVAWDPFGLKHAGENAVNDLINGLEHKLIPEVAQAVREEVERIFDVKLPAFIGNVSSAVADLEDHAEEDAEKLMGYAVGNLTHMFSGAIDQVSKLINATVTEVKDALDNFVDVHLAGLVDHVFDGVEQLLTRVEKDVQKLVCEEAAIVKQMELFIQQEVGALDCGCTLKVKNEWGETCPCRCSKILPAKMTCKCSPAQWITINDVLSYEYIECTQRKAIEGGKIPVGHIVSLLGGLRSLAEQLRCYHFPTDGPKATVTQWYTDKILALSHEKYVWQHPVELPTAHAIVEAAATSQSRSSPLRVQRRQLVDCSDKTPYACWQLATQAAEEAKQAYQSTIKSIDDKAARSELNETNQQLKALQAQNQQLQASVTLLQSQVTSLNSTVGTLSSTLLTAAHTDAAAQVKPVADNLAALTNTLKNENVVADGYSLMGKPPVCTVKNPLTGGCSCPGGYTALELGGFGNLGVFLCVKPAA